MDALTILLLLRRRFEMKQDLSHGTYNLRPANGDRTLTIAPQRS